MTSRPTARRSRRALGALVTLGLVATPLALTSAPAQAGEAPTEHGRPDFVLTVLHNNDGESDLLPDETGAGSISRFGGLVKDLRREWRTKRSGEPSKRKGVVLISAGDNFLAGPEWEASQQKGMPYYDAIALDHLRYEAFTIGNHEFDFGPDELARFIRSFRGNDDIFLSANLDFSAEPALQRLADRGRIRPKVVVRERGERIGIVGVTTPELREVSSPGDVVIDPDLVAVVQEQVDRLTARGVDKILVSSHLQDITNELELVTQLRHVDAVIGGGGGEDISASYPLVAQDATGRDVPVVTVPGDYFDVGRLTLRFDKYGNVVGFGGELVPVTGDLPQDRFLLNNVEEPVTAFLADLANQVIATTQVALNGVRADVRSRETNIGNLMADAHLAAAQARAADFGVQEPQVALQNGGGIRNDDVIPVGDVTLLDTFEIAAFSNAISVIEDVSRDDILAAAQHGVSGLPAAQGFFGQWAGLRIEYSTDGTGAATVQNITLDDGTQIVAGGVVVPGPGVTVATIDFLARGQDGYDMFEPYDFTSLGVSYQQSLAQFLESLGTITDEYADPVDPADRERVVPLP
ncbi:bifunctional metallophosphatase/5'-nucleotidase [Nocardioides sp. GCM10027113]|uniref:bifunctional metallophosphatase/5'-nucleotidase n=1 Tax=unclassified Nocardioides TaxID=2615069 RepID=UPI0036206627